jgi:CHASE2 domain-containing sensor protein
MSLKKINRRKFFLQLQKNLAIVGFSFIIVWGYAGIALNLSFLNPISEAIKSFSITDKYYQMMAEKDSRLIVLVDLTNLFDRADIAQALEEIEACNPAVIGMDCVFEGEKEDTASDNAIRRVAEKYDNIVFSYRLVDEQEGIGYSRSIHSFFTDETSVHEGVTNMLYESHFNRIKRKLKAGWLVNGNLEPTLVGEVANIYAQEKVINATDKDININFHPTRFTKLDPSEILQNRDQIEGRIVLFGTLTEETDMHFTPLGKIAGVELLAYATQSILEKEEIKKFPFWIQIIISVILVILSNILQLTYIDWTTKSESPFIRYVIGSAYILGVLTFLWIALILWITFLCFSIYGISIDIGWPVAAMAFLATSRSFYAACEAYYKLWKERKQK